MWSVRFTSPVIIKLGMLVMYCMQFVVSVSWCRGVVVWCRGVFWYYVYVGYGDVLEVFCVYFRSCISVFFSHCLCSLSVRMAV